MSDERNSLFVWVDLETSGLDANVPSEAIFSSGIKVTDLDLNTVAEQEWLIWGGWEQNCWGNAVDFVRDMHAKTGLIERCKVEGLPRPEVELAMHGFLDQFDLNPRKTPLCGSSVQFDRNFMAHWMPTFLFSNFSYRNIDVSSFKEAFEHKRPDLIPLRDKAYLHEDKVHSVLADLDDTVAEFGFYYNLMGEREES